MRLCVLPLMLLLAPPVARAQDSVHADLPIWTGKNGDEMWPQGFSDADGWGCTARVSFGDWRFVPLESDGNDLSEQWWRVTNYGVFHCYAIVRAANEREELAQARPRHSFFVKMAEIGKGDARIELWALQMGTRPGSDYLLLARKPGQGLITDFDVLTVRCPRAHIRDAGSIEISGTAYCAINARADLIAFARRMARLPYAGKFVRAGDAVDEAGDMATEDQDAAILTTPGSAAPAGRSTPDR